MNSNNCYHMLKVITSLVLILRMAIVEPVSSYYYIRKIRKLGKKKKGLPRSSGNLLLAEDY